MPTRIDLLYITSVILCVATLGHNVIYYGLIIASGKQCAMDPTCPSWMIPGNVETNVLSGVIQIIVALLCLCYIYTPCNMRYFQHAEGQRVAGNPCMMASTSVGTSAILGVWLVASFLNIFIATAYESTEYPPDYRYYLHVITVITFIALDILLIWLVAGVSQLYVDPLARFSANNAEKKQFRRFRASAWMIAIRIFFGIVYLMVQFVVDYTITTTSNQATAYVSLYLYGAFTMIVLMLLYKIYLVQLMVRKALDTARDPFAASVSSFDIADPTPVYEPLN